MSKNSYKNAEGAFGAAGIAASAVGAGAMFGNPAGGVINAQNAYHEHQFKKGRNEGNGKAIANHDRAKAEERSKNTPQGQASVMTGGANGINEANGFVTDKNGKVTYVGKKK